MSDGPIAGGFILPQSHLNAGKIEELEKRLTEMERRYNTMVKAFSEIHYNHSLDEQRMFFPTLINGVVVKAVIILSENNDDIS